MIKKLKHILNTYTDEELENIELWINSDDVLEQIMIDKYNINLITEDAEVRVNGFIDKAGKGD